MLGGAQNSRRSNGDLASSQREIGARHRAGRAQGEDRGETGPVFSKKVEAAVRPLRAEVCVVQGRVRMVGVTGQYLTRGERKGGRLPRPYTPDPIRAIFAVGVEAVRANRSSPMRNKRGISVQNHGKIPHYCEGSADCAIAMFSDERG
jgi:hypothetical protein